MVLGVDNGSSSARMLHINQLQTPTRSVVLETRVSNLRIALRDRTYDDIDKIIVGIGDSLNARGNVPCNLEFVKIVEHPSVAFGEACIVMSEEGE